jgi:lactoylglutathione lyase
MNHWIQVLGFVSAFLTTISFLPQAVKTWRTRSTSDLSPLMFALFCLGVTGWLFYGIMLNDLPMIFANSFTICLAGTIMYFIIRGNQHSSISHIAFYVHDIEKMKSFYCNAFNGRAGKLYKSNKNKFTSYFISFPSGTRLELMQMDGLEIHEKKVWHMAISVGSKVRVDEIITLFRSKEITILSEPRFTGDGYYEAVIADPEGNQIEITI